MRMAAKHSATVEKVGVVVFSRQKALMQGLARALLSALNSTSVLVTVDVQLILEMYKLI